ncbi:hypothetical protein C2845_PM11G18210 [Panicum miliaceum]|uniref:Uncharacterized protein n=1 Tax=Panicum miliaceum TaxID=4540 RepID=A0A3L6RRJ2_PANMI|nr:hypothetical protein C2845_PM11G18210 [Panicum miliaceum]
MMASSPLSSVGSGASRRRVGRGSKAGGAAQAKMLLTALFGAGAALLGWQHLPLASQIRSKVHSLSSPSSRSQTPSSPSRGHRLARPRRRHDGLLALARPQYGLRMQSRAPPRLPSPLPMAAASSSWAQAPRWPLPPRGLPLL